MSLALAAALAVVACSLGLGACSSFNNRGRRVLEHGPYTALPGKRDALAERFANYTAVKSPP
jgi:hypothetical protein